jgi:hypothetical protein
MVEQFPPIKIENLRKGGEDRNPAVQLFGRRFFADQTVQELLSEFLLVASSIKKINSARIPPDRIFPDFNLLLNWPGETPLEYAAKARLNLKLFSFLGASKLETRHKSHQQHYRKLLNLLASPEKLVRSESMDTTEVLRTLENLFLGFQGVGGQRTWCAQAFVPIARNFIGAESIWKKTLATANDITDWNEALNYFAYNQHIFLARGGELLYLQICNSLRQEEETLINWAQKNGLSFSNRESFPLKLHNALNNAINSVLNACPDTIGKLADFIDIGIESETAKLTEYDRKSGEPRFTRCGWCPTESWPEGFLFAVEMLRISEAAIDPIERLELMEVACAMQVLRSLCAQSARYVGWVQERKKYSGPLNYVWAISDPTGHNNALKQISKRCVNNIQKMIYDAVRNSNIKSVLKEQKADDDEHGIIWKDPYREVDTRYGYKLFLTLSKRIGLIVPKRGAGARFILNDKLIRFLVMSVIRPGERMRYNTFKNLIFAHYGIALDKEKIGQACEWCGSRKLSTLGEESDLSDAHSLVVNPFK